MLAFLTVTSIELYTIALWLCGGFFVGFGWAFAHWLVTRITSRIS